MIDPLKETLSVLKDLGADMDMVCIIKGSYCETHGLSLPTFQDLLRHLGVTIKEA